MKESINVVWLKRDIRSQDHLPLHLAESDPLPYLIIYIFEPSLISTPDFSLRHLQFIYHSIQHLNSILSNTNRKLETMYGEAQEVYNEILNQFNVKKVFSYQESGTMVTWQRDKKIKHLFNNNQIRWTECQRDGIIRGITDRKDWDKEWHVTMAGDTIQNTYSKRAEIKFKHPFIIPTELLNQWSEYPTQYQPAGEEFAWKYLHTFT